jgi:transcriptional regulator with XRE-family HTH domain
MVSGEQIRAAREARKWSQEKLAASVGVARNTIVRYEGGAAMGVQTLDVICAALGIDASGADAPSIASNVIPEWWLRVWLNADESRRMALANIFGGSR